MFQDANREKRYMRTWKHLNTVIGRWTNCEVKLLQFSITHSSYTLLVTHEDRLGNLVVGGGSCKFLSGPTRWRSKRLEFVFFPAKDHEDDQWVLSDPEAGFVAVSWNLGATENIKNVKPTIPYSDLVIQSGPMPEAGDKQHARLITETLSRWAGHPADVAGCSGGDDGGLMIRLGPRDHLSKCIYVGLDCCQYLSGPTRQIQFAFDDRSKTYTIRDTQANFIAIGTAIRTYELPEKHPVPQINLI